MYLNNAINSCDLQQYKHLLKSSSFIERRLLIDKGSQIDKYEIEGCIGRGGYADVYGAIIPGQTKVYAIKIEDKFSEKNKEKEVKKLSLNKEIKYIKKLQDSLDIPHFYDQGETDRYLFYVMELLGPSLSTVRKELPHKKFTLSTTLRVGIKMLRIIQYIHRHGFVHCDVKPGNFLLRPDCLHFLVLSDFGLMRTYIVKNDRKYSHIQMEPNAGFAGTIEYSSPNSMMRNTLSRKDDLLSWIYSIYELKNGHLPWSRKKRDEMMQTKINFTTLEFFKKMPSEIQDIFLYINSLEFDEEPNYDWIVDSILKAMNRKKIKTTDPFDWERLPDDKIVLFSPIAELPKATWYIVQDPKPILSRPGNPNYSNIKSSFCRFCMCCSIRKTKFTFE